jgi:prenyltransferase beta subunit
MRNYYVTIGLTRHQRALLKKTAALWGFDEQPCAEAALQLVMLGLANLALITKRWEVHANYCMKEDFMFSRYLDGVAAHDLKVFTDLEKR